MPPAERASRFQAGERRSRVHVCKSTSCWTLPERKDKLFISFYEHYSTETVLLNFEDRRKNRAKIWQLEATWTSIPAFVTLKLYSKGHRNI